MPCVWLAWLAHTHCISLVQACKEGEPAHTHTHTRAHRRLLVLHEGRRTSPSRRLSVGGTKCLPTSFVEPTCVHCCDPAGIRAPQLGRSRRRVGTPRRQHSPQWCRPAEGLRPARRAGRRPCTPSHRQQPAISCSVCLCARSVGCTCVLGVLCVLWACVGYMGRSHLPRRYARRTGRVMSRAAAACVRLQQR